MRVQSIVFHNWLVSLFTDFVGEQNPNLIFFDDFNGSFGPTMLYFFIPSPPKKKYAKYAHFC